MPCPHARIPPSDFTLSSPETAWRSSAPSGSADRPGRSRPERRPRSLILQVPVAACLLGPVEGGVGTRAGVSAFFAGTVLGESATEAGKWLGCQPELPDPAQDAVCHGELHAG